MILTDTNIGFLKEPYKYEACVGIAKHWNNVLYKMAPADAYSAFKKLSQQEIDGINDVE